MTIIDKDWLATLRRDRVGFARELATELTRTAAQLHALAALAEHYFEECAKSPSSPGPARPAEAEARPGVSSDAGEPGPERIGVQVDGEPSAEAGGAGQPAPIPARPDTESGAGTSTAESPGAKAEAAVPPLSPRPTIPETSEHPGAPLDPMRAEASPPASSDAMASDLSDVGAAPAGNAERPPQPILPEPAARLTMKEQVLRLWANSEKTADQIAAEVGCSKGSVHTYLSEGRRSGDDRAFARSSAAPVPKPALPPAGQEREPSVAGFAKPVERKPFDPPKSSPLDPRPGRLTGVTITRPGSVVSLDMENFIVACPCGDWQVTRPVALVMEHMRNGDTFDHQTLAEIGSMSLSTFSDSRKRWAEDLAARGVEFVHTKGVGCKIRVAGT